MGWFPSALRVNKGTAVATIDPDGVSRSNEKASNQTGESKLNDRKGIKNRFTRIMGGVPSLKNLHQPLTMDAFQDMFRFVISHVKEAAIYLVFLLLFTIVIFQSRNNMAFWMNASLKDVLIKEGFNEAGSATVKTFEDIASEDDFWLWMKNPLVNGIYDDRWRRHDDRIPHVLRTNKLLGGVRFRQLRVRHGCDIANDMEGLFDSGECNPAFSTSRESKVPFSMNPITNQPFEWQSADEIGEGWEWGRLAWYPGSGFTMLLPTSSSSAEVLAIIQSLEENSYIDFQSRAVFVEFALYNPAVNLFCVAQLLVEFPASGGATSWSFMRVVNLIRYETGGDYGILVLELILMCMVIGYSIEEGREFHKKRMLYLKDPWNFLDIVNILIFYCVFGLRVSSVVGTHSLAPEIRDPTTFTSLNRLAYLVEQEQNLNAVNAFLCYLKVFKYTRLNPRLSQLVHTLGHASVDIVYFSFIFFTVLVGMSTMAYMSFGADIAEFRSWNQSMLNLFASVSGDVNFGELYEVNRVMGPFFYIIFFMLVFFVLLNMFLAIINSAYEHVRRDVDREAKASGYHLQILKQGLRSKLRRGSAVDLNAFKVVDQDQNGQVSIAELAGTLEKTLGVSSQNAEQLAKSVIEKYDDNKSGTLSGTELKKFNSFLSHEASRMEGVEEESDVDNEGYEGDDTEGDYSQVRSSPKLGLPHPDQGSSTSPLPPTEIATLHRLAVQVDRICATLGVDQKMLNLETKLRSEGSIHFIDEDSLRTPKKNRKNFNPGVSEPRKRAVKKVEKDWEDSTHGVVPGGSNSSRTTDAEIDEVVRDLQF